MRRRRRQQPGGGPAIQPAGCARRQPAAWARLRPSRLHARAPLVEVLRRCDPGSSSPLQALLGPCARRTPSPTTLRTLEVDTKPPQPLRPASQPRTPHHLPAHPARVSPRAARIQRAWRRPLSLNLRRPNLQQAQPRLPGALVAALHRAPGGRAPAPGAPPLVRCVLAPRRPLTADTLALSGPLGSTVLARIAPAGALPPAGQRAWRGRRHGTLLRRRQPPGRGLLSQRRCTSPLHRSWHRAGRSACRAARFCHPIDDA